MEIITQSIKSLFLAVILLSTGMATKGMERYVYKPKESKEELKKELRQAELDWYEHVKKERARATPLDMQSNLERNKINSPITPVPSLEPVIPLVPVISQPEEITEAQRVISEQVVSEQDSLAPIQKIINCQALIRGYLERKKTHGLQKLATSSTTSQVQLVENLKKTITALALSEGKTPLTEQELTEMATKECLAIQRGAALAKRIFIDEEDISGISLIHTDPVDAHKNKDRFADATFSEYLQAIMDLQSFFYSLCFQIRSDGIGFDEGTFHIEDSKGLLQKFLQGYLTKIAISRYPLGNKESNHWFASNPYAYYRANSHNFKDSFGIDYRFDKDKPTETWMMKFKHMLVAFTPQGVWIKPEHHGCNYDEVIGHGKNYFSAQWTKLTSKFIGSKGDDDERNNKDRVPRNETQEFKNLFPGYQGSMTIGSMFEYAQQALTKKPKNATAVQNFVNHLKRNFSHVCAYYDKDTRWGNEIKLTFDELLTAYFYTTENNALQGFFQKFVDLKKNILQFKCKNYNVVMSDATIQQTISKDQAYGQLLFHIEEFIGCQATVHTMIDNLEIQSYFERIAHVLQIIIKDKDCMSLLEQESIFETDYQKDFMRTEQDKEEKKKEHDKKLHLQAKALMEEDAEKIKLAGDIDLLIIDFCNTTYDQLKELCNFNDIQVNEIVSIPSLEVVQQKINNATLRDAVIKTALDQTTGFQKTTELRMFEYKTSNPYVKSYNFKVPTKKLAEYIYALTLAADTQEKQEALIYFYEKLQKTWEKTFQAIGKCAEACGYITSLSDEGKRIIETACEKYRVKKDALLAWYQQHHLTQEPKNDDGLKVVLQEITRSYASTESFIKNWFMAEKGEQMLTQLAEQQLNGALKPFDLQQCGDIASLQECANCYLKGAPSPQSQNQMLAVQAKPESEGYGTWAYNLGATALGYVKFWQ